MKNTKMSHLLAAAALAALPLAGIVGCDNSEPTPDTPAAAEKQMDAAKTSGADAEDVKDKMQDTVENTKDAAAGAADKASDMAADAGDKAGGMTEMAGDQASKMLNQVQGYIDDKKYDLADSTLKKVEGMTGKMPEALQTQVKNLRQQLNTAMAASEKGAMEGAGK